MSDVCLFRILCLSCNLCCTFALRKLQISTSPFNTKKTVALRIVARYKNDCVALVLPVCDAQLQYVQQVKYLGIVLVPARE